MQYKRGNKNYHTQCPEIFSNKIEKKFTQDLHRIEKFSSEIPNLFFSKIQAVRAWNPPAKHQCNLPNSGCIGCTA